MCSKWQKFIDKRAADVNNDSMNVTLSFTEAEANQLAKLLDSAVRAEGLAVAEVAVALFNRLKVAAKLAKAAPVQPDTAHAL